MRHRVLPALVGTALAFLPAQAAQLTSNAVLVKSGPSATDDVLGPVWISECTDGRRIVGLRLIRNGGLTGVAALCATLRNHGRGLEWASTPLPTEGPPMPPPPPMVTRPVDHVVSGQIGRRDETGAFITRTEVSFVVTRVETIPDPSIPPAPPVVAFADGKAADMLCPQGHYLQGVRHETGAEGVSRLDLVCSDGTGRATTVDTVLKGKKTKASVAPAVQRIDCGSQSTNPDDGLAARSVFGTVEDGKVRTIGLSCERTTDPIGSLRSIAMTAVRFAEELPRDLRFPKTFADPTGPEGKKVAVCTSGEDEACVKRSADSFCKSGGYLIAVSYSVGKPVRNAASPAGDSCGDKRCKAFSEITCDFR